MKRTVFFLMTFIALSAQMELMARATEPVVPHANPAVYEQNRAPMRSSFIVYPSVRDVKPGSDYRTSPNYRSIEGEWRFAWYNHATDPRPAEFFVPTFDDSAWDTMPIPGMWELNGYGDPLYCNKGFAWDNVFVDNPPQVPTHRNHVGQYRRCIEVPAEWRGKQVFVHIGSATSNLALWINGKKVGYSEDSKLEAEFDITKYVRCGAENLFAMEIHRWCDGSYLEDQDFWRLSGIARDCYIYARERAHVKDVKFVADLANDYRDGVLSLDVDVTPGVKYVEAVLCDAQDNPLYKRRIVPSGGKICERVEIAGVRAWSAEIPYLYTLTLSTPDESMAFNVGFRKVEIRDAQLLVNGRAVLIKGANRHEISSTGGYVMSREEMLRDIRIMKEHNVNAVRTCHYPNSPLWYDLCDEYGIYVVDEANVESHGMGYGKRSLAHREDYRAAHLARNQRVVMRDFNHPSVIVWSLGNEAGNGANFHACYDWIKGYDRSRPVQYEQANHIRYGDVPKNYNSDIECPMYASYNDCEKYASGEPKRPLIQCEYAHAMGNSLGGFKEYWDLVRKYPNYQGGFIWDFVDQALSWRDPQTGVTFYRYGGCYNDVDPSDETFCNNGFISASRTPHPSAREVWHQYQNIWSRDVDARRGVVEVYNEHFFRDLSGYALHWSVTQNGIEVLHGVVETLDVEPMQSKRVQLGYAATDIERMDGEVILTLKYLLKADEPLLTKGHCAGFNQIVLAAFDAQAAFDAAQTVTGTADMLEIDADNRVIRGNGFEVGFAGNGFLNRYMFAGKQLISKPLMPLFYRAMTENDFGARKRAKSAAYYHSWKMFRETMWYMELFVMERKGDSVEVKTQYSYSELGMWVDVVYVIDPQGRVRVQQSMRPGKHNIDCCGMLRYGMAMAMPATFSTIEFYGAGPHESYADRKSSAPVGLYRQSVNEQFCMTYSRPQESGAHCDLRYWSITDAEGCGFKVLSNVLFTASALPYEMKQYDIHSVDYCKYPQLLKKDGNTYVNIDMAQSGIVCENSWGALPLEEYRISYKAHSFEFVLLPLK